MAYDLVEDSTKLPLWAGQKFPGIGGIELLKLAQGILFKSDDGSWYFADPGDLLKIGPGGRLKLAALAELNLPPVAFVKEVQEGLESLASSS